MGIPDIVTSPPVRTDRVRAIALMAKKTDMSDAAFFKHWQEVHGPLFAGLDIVKRNILKYEQVSSFSFRCSALCQKQSFIPTEQSLVAPLYRSI